MVGRKDYFERKDEKMQRYEDLASKAAIKGEELSNKAYNKMHSIPLGQPILIGHYSEKQDRKFRDSIDNDLDKMSKENSKSQYYEEKLNAMKNNKAISSDNPDAIKLLEEKISKLKEKQKTLKEMNKYYKKNKTMKGFKGITEEQAEKIDENLKNNSWLGGKPAPSYELTNLNQQIKNAENRIMQLKEIDEMQDEIFDFDLGYIHSNQETNRIEIYFDEKPNEEIRNELKMYGFKWSPNAKAWQRLRNKNSLRIAKRIFNIED